jgi:hypothetical protein
VATTWKSDRGRVAALTRAVRNGERPPDDPALIEARRSMRANLLAEHVEKVVAGWPPLTDAQLDRIAGLLRAGGAGA